MPTGSNLDLEYSNLVVPALTAICSVYIVADHLVLSLSLYFTCCEHSQLIFAIVTCVKNADNLTITAIVYSGGSMDIRHSTSRAQLQNLVWLTG